MGGEEPNSVKVSSITFCCSTKAGFSVCCARDKFNPGISSSINFAASLSANCSSVKPPCIISAAFFLFLLAFLNCNFLSY
jgi:hypothetical protein